MFAVSRARKDRSAANRATAAIPALAKGKLLQQRGVEDGGVRSTQGIASDVADRTDSGRGVGIGCGRRKRAAGAVLAGIEPAVGIAYDMRLADEVWHRGGEAVWIEHRVAIAIVFVHLERMTAIERVDTGGSPVAEDPRGRATVQHPLSMTEGQLVHVADGDAIRNVEVAGTIPRRVITPVRSVAGVGLEFFGSIVETARVGECSSQAKPVSEAACEAGLQAVVVSKADR